MSDVPSSPTHDPTLLSIIARGLNQTKGRKDFSSFGSDTDRRQARVLDSLAYLLVSREAEQTIAIGLRLCSDGPGLELLVAENVDVLPTTLDHAIFIIRRLREIYMVLPFQDKPSRIATFYTSNTESVFERRIIELECAIIKHSWAKLLQRLRKHSRYLYFLDTARDVCGLPVAERADIIDDKERGYLHTLQTSEVFTRNDIETQFEMLDNLVTPSGLGELGDTAAEDVRLLLHRMVTWKERIQRSNSYRCQWDAYTSCRLDRRQHTAGNEALARQDASDVAHWLAKVTEICGHFHRLVDVVISPKLSPILLNIIGARPVLESAPSLRDQTVSLSYEELRHVLDTRNVSEARRLLRNIGSMPSATWADVDEERVVLEPGPVHSECQILMHVHSHSAVPYIGVSKLSCARCDMYLSVYRSKTGAGIYTRGTNGQIIPWTYPSLGNSEKAPAIEKLVRSRLLNMIWHGWDDYIQLALDAGQQ